MGDKFLAALALAVLAGFLGILVWNVPRLDLACVVALTLGLAVYDFVRGFRTEGKRQK
ncbi:hypothetical protein [Oricola thermophila]|uniref:Uncharacterized protein n=1 Tax=Oricola thermophila TaxID=2742145 RepID=A0A6N1VFP8_9HYPH|nr:hypothetical protein [Oricola thermophila]QKV19393.1 hypothetical protein HTY61_13460 [Oricola thermophila]